MSLEDEVVVDSVAAQGTRNAANGNGAGVGGDARGYDQASRFNRSTSAWKAGVSLAIRVSMSRT